MKKVFTIFIMCTLLFSVFGCKEKAVITEDEDRATIPITITSMKWDISDCFIGRVTDVYNAGNVQFADFDKGSTDVHIYSVEVNKALWAVTATEGSTVRVARIDWQSVNEDSNTERLEIGKTYLFGGKVQLSSAGVCLKDETWFTAELKDDGTLVSLSDARREVFADIKTFDEFMEAEPVKNIIENCEPEIPYCFRSSASETNVEITRKSGAALSSRQKLVKAGDAQPDRQQLIEYLREAVKVNSTIEMMPATRDGKDALKRTGDEKVDY